MSRRKEILAAIAAGEIQWGYQISPATVVRQIKHMEAEERNAATAPERRRARRVWTTPERRTRHYTAKGSRR